MLNKKINFLVKLFMFTFLVIISSSLTFAMECKDLPTRPGKIWWISTKIKCYYYKTINRCVNGLGACEQSNSDSKIYRTISVYESYIRECGGCNSEIDFNPSKLSEKCPFWEGKGIGYSAVGIYSYSCKRNCGEGFDDHYLYVNGILVEGVDRDGGFGKPYKFTCDRICGNDAGKCARKKPWNRGSCYEGQECNDNCRCEWVDRDLDNFKMQGYDGPQQTAYDCNDRNSFINPNMSEKCNNVDDDCDGNLDEGDICKRTIFVCENNTLCE